MKKVLLVAFSTTLIAAGAFAQSSNLKSGVGGGAGAAIAKSAGGGAGAALGAGLGGGVGAALGRQLSK